MKTRNLSVSLVLLASCFTPPIDPSVDEDGPTAESSTTGEGAGSSSGEASGEATGESDSDTMPALEESSSDDDGGTSTGAESPCGLFPEILVDGFEGGQIGDLVEDRPGWECMDSGLDCSANISAGQVSTGEMSMYLTGGSREVGMEDPVLAEGFFVSFEFYDSAPIDQYNAITFLVGDAPDHAIMMFGAYAPTCMDKYCMANAQTGGVGAVLGPRGIGWHEATLEITYTTSEAWVALGCIDGICGEYEEGTAIGAFAFDDNGVFSFVDSFAICARR